MSSQTILHDTTKVIAAARDMTVPTLTSGRFGEPVKFVPMLFVLSIVFGLSFIYILCHCFPLMAEERTFAHGWSCLVAFSVVDVMLVTCFIRAAVQHPGTIPEPSSSGEGDAIWEYAPRDERAASPTLETKKGGVRRHCKWCNKYKPDRCHHCRVCRMCILKMDHHCPWIYNCVGFKNYKYFVLTIMYAAIGCHIVVWTMFPTMRQTSVNANIPFVWVFFILFAESLAGLMALLLTAFLGFHIHLMIKAMTTIEFCEKSQRKSFDNDKYSCGIIGNVKAVLGDNVLLWLLPISLPSGDGMTFSTGSQGKGKDEGLAKGLYGTMHAGTGEAPDTPTDSVHICG